MLVDLDMGQVTQLTQHADRVIRDVAKTNIVRAHVNMFLPNAIVVEPGSTIRSRSNPCNLPHNVVGILNETAAAAITNNVTGLNRENRTSYANETAISGDSGSKIAVDSGFIQPGLSWQYRFDQEAIFNYFCTIHAVDGMRGTLIISSSS